MLRLYSWWCPQDSWTWYGAGQKATVSKREQSTLEAKTLPLSRRTESSCLMALNNSSGEVHTLDLFQRHVCLDRRAASAQNKSNPNEFVALPWSRYFSRAPREIQRRRQSGVSVGGGRSVRVFTRTCIASVRWMSERKGSTCRHSTEPDGEHTRPSGAAVLNNAARTCTKLYIADILRTTKSIFCHLCSL